MNALACHTISSVDELRRLEPAWWRLWRRCPRATPFQSPAWLLPWWDAFTPGELAVIAVQDGTELVALAPLYREVGDEGARLLPLGISLSDCCDVLIGEERRSEAQILLAAAVSAEGIPLLWPDAMLDGDVWGVPLPPGWREETGPSEPCPVLSLRGASPKADDAPDCVPAGRRRKWRMALHRARQRGDVTVMSGGDVRPAEFIDALWRLHRDRWQSRGEGGVLEDTRVRAFHGTALPRLAAAGMADLRLLDIGGVIAGAYLGLQNARRSYAYLGGFDPAFLRESPGAILLGSAIDAAVRRGAEEFDFLRGREPYKYSWGAVDRPQGWRRLVPELGVG